MRVAPGLAALLMIVALPACAREPDPADATPLSGKTWLITGGFDAGVQPDGNSVILAGEDGLIVFDTGRHPSHRAKIERVIGALDRPLVAIVNSHWHLDHVSGNLGLKDAHPAVQVHASNAIDGALAGFLKRSADGARAALAEGRVPKEHEGEARRDLATFDAGARLRPDVVVAADGDVALAGRPVSLRLAPNAATEGDVWLHDAANARVLAGDLVTLPAPFFDTACPDGWLRALDTIAATRFTSLVPGHGPVMDQAQFASYRTAFARFVGCAKGTGDVRQCASGWVADAGPLVPSAERGRAARMAAYYAGLIRSGSLDRNCTA